MMDDRNKKTNDILKRTAGFIFVALISVLWLLFEIRLWNDNALFSIVEKQLFIDIFGSGRIDNLNNDINMIYLVTLPPVLLGYFLLVLWERNHPFKGDARKKVLCTGILILLLFIFALFFYILVFRSLNSYIIAGIVILEFLFILGSIYIPSVIQNHKKFFSGKAIAGSAARYGLCLVISVLIALVYGLALSILSSLEKNATITIISQFSVELSKISGIFSLLIMAPLVEEIAFRGLIFGKSKQFVPVWIAAVFTAVLFGIWHRNLEQFCATVPMGLIVAFVYQQTGRLRYAMVCHSVSNLILALSITNSGILSSVPFLHRLQRSVVYDLPLPASIVFLVIASAIIIMMIWKLLPLVSKETAAVENMPESAHLKTPSVPESQQKAK